MVAVVHAVWTGVTTATAVWLGVSMVSATLIFIIEVVAYIVIYMRLLGGHLPMRNAQPDSEPEMRTGSPVRERLVVIIAVLGAAWSETMRWPVIGL